MFSNVNSSFYIGKIHYFWLIPPVQWSFEDFSSWIATHSLSDVDDISHNNNYIFYNMLHILEADSSTPANIQDIVSKLMKQKRKNKNAKRKHTSSISSSSISESALISSSPTTITPSVSTSTITTPSVLTSTTTTPSVLTSTTTPSVSTTTTIASSSKKRKMDSIMKIALPLPHHSDLSLDILRVLEMCISELDSDIISQGSTRSYKSSKHLWVDSNRAVSVPRESTYEAELYRVLVSWLKHLHNIEINSQWHIEQIGNDGELHHSFCDLTLKYATKKKPIAILELLATASRPILDKHFLQIFSYAQQLQPSELWIVHFTREDNFIIKPYWPSKELQQKGLNVVHFWHNESFTHVRMSARFLVNNNIKEIINQQILP